MRTNEGADKLLLVLLVIGGINWGLVGLFDFDLVATVFGPGSIASRIIYILVGVSAVYILTRYFSNRLNLSRA